MLQYASYAGMLNAADYIPDFALSSATTSSSNFEQDLIRFGMNHIMSDCTDSNLIPTAADELLCYACMQMLQAAFMILHSGLQFSIH